MKVEMRLGFHLAPAELLGCPAIECLKRWG